MSLLSGAMEDFIIQDKKTIADGYGGFSTQWTDGALIQCVAVLNTSIEMSVAQALGSTSKYTVTTNKNINLQYHDVIKRVRDNKIFRITSDGDDKATPQSAMLDMRQVTAEEWNLVD